MANSSIRQYATKKYIASRTDLAEGEILVEMINMAEMFIDAWIRDEIGDFGKFIDGEIVSTGTFTESSLTDSVLLDRDYKNFYSFCNIEIISGDKAGTILSVTSSEGDSLQFDTVAELSGTLDYRLFQIGKFPRYIDATYSNSKYYKTIPFEIKEAIAYQVKYMEDEPDIFEESGMLGSESISESYSYSVGQGGGGINALSDVKYIAPKARVLLKKYMIQSI